MPSQTQPDESYSVREILEKFTRGVDPMLTKLGDYDIEEDNPELEEDVLSRPDLRRYEDLTDENEIKAFILSTKAREKGLQDRLKKLKEEKKSE
nr:MAG: hypothetical protein [Microvirus sp.]